jgi:hypothetical protein
MSTYYKKIVSIVTFTILTIGFSACGGGGGDSSFSNGQEIIPIDVNCTTSAVTPADITTYVALESGDAIVKNDNNTTVEIYHDVDGIKKVCVQLGGSAHIVR